MNIFITGVSGFVGTNLVNYFKDRGGVMPYGSSRQMKSNLPEKLMLVTDYSAATLNELKIDIFIHLAGIAHDLNNQYEPKDYYTVNFEGTKNAVDEFLKSNARAFIFVSSIKAVCDTSSIPADESVKPAPMTDYGKSKWQAEEYIQRIAPGSDKKFYILRPAMIHGPGSKGNLNLLYRFAKSGLPFPFGAFHNQRSFLSIGNFNYAIDTIINKDVAPGTYHLADDGFLSTMELYSLLCKAMNSKIRIWNVPKKLIQVMAALIGRKNMITKLTEDMMISNEKILKALNSPFPVGLKEGLVTTIRSFDGK